MPVTTAEAQARMRAKLEELARQGVERVVLYGAGRHTLKVGEVLGDAPLEVVGVVDDLRGGRGLRLWGWPILSPEEAAASKAQAVVISSDGAEDKLYQAKADWFRARGLAVHRLYGVNGASQDGAAGDEANTRTDRFTDSNGKVFELIPGYRSKVKPGWEQMLQWQPGDYPTPSLEDARAAMRHALRRITFLDKYLRTFGFSFQGKDVLEIGCWDGACSQALALRGCRRAVGIDYQDYFLWNVEPEAITDQQRAAARANLLAVQEVTAQAATEMRGEAAADSFGQVELYVDDIRRCTLPDASFDLMVSWQTMEHLVPPEVAFAAMARLLRPGGVAFHEYGAFTCHKGGHALCTLDFPWGHLRLSDADVERYLRTLRPAEYEHAIRHYRRFLNRLTLAHLARLADANGLELVDRTVWLNRQHFEDEYQPEYLEEARNHYPDLSLHDMVHDDVWVLLRKR